MPAASAGPTRRRGGDRDATDTSVRRRGRQWRPATKRDALLVSGNESTSVGIFTIEYDQGVHDP